MDDSWVNVREAQTALKFPLLRASYADVPGIPECARQLIACQLIPRQIPAPASLWKRLWETGLSILYANPISTRASSPSSRSLDDYCISPFRSQLSIFITNRSIQQHTISLLRNTRDTYFIRWCGRVFPKQTERNENQSNNSFTHGKSLLLTNTYWMWSLFSLYDNGYDVGT